MPRIDEKVLVIESYPYRVPDLYQVYSPNKLIRGIRHGRVKELKKISKNDHHTWCPNRIFDLISSNQEYSVRKRETTDYNVCKKPKAAHKGKLSFIVTLATHQTIGMAMGRQGEGTNLPVPISDILRMSLSPSELLERISIPFPNNNKGSPITE